MSDLTQEARPVDLVDSGLQVHDQEATDGVDDDLANEVAPKPSCAGRSYRIANGNNQRFCCETAKSLLQPPVGGGRPSFSMLLRSTGDAGDDSAGYGAFGRALTTA